jgi:uncharacterized protein
MDQQKRPPLAPFDEAAAREKVKKVQDAWNIRDPEKVSFAYTEDSVRRNRDEFCTPSALVPTLTIVK